MALSDNKKEEIMGVLREKIHGCPICGHSQWTLHEEVVGANTVSLGGSIHMGGPFIPMVQLICNSCGFVSHHAVGVLGIKLK